MSPLTPTIDQRIAALEAQFSPSIPGTQITRVMKPDRGFEWCVAIGSLGMAKVFFHGDTIEDALTRAELAAVTPEKMTPVDIGAVIASFGNDEGGRRRGKTSP